LASFASLSVMANPPYHDELKGTDVVVEPIRDGPSNFAQAYGDPETVENQSRLRVCNETSYLDSET
jgi:hypothetical protein